MDVLEHSVPRTIRGAKTVFSVSDPNQLDELCGAAWDRHVFGDGRFKVINKIWISTSKSSNSFLLNLTGYLDDDVYTPEYRADTQQYFQCFSF